MSAHASTRSRTHEYPRDRLSEKAALIHTGLQPGDKQRRELVNRFNGLLVFLKSLRRLATKELPRKRHGETVVTVPMISRSSNTGLKPGVNESKTHQTVSNTST